MNPQTANGGTTVVHTLNLAPDPIRAMKDIIRLLDIDDDHDAHDDEMYEAWLANRYAGCQSCVAAFIARAVVEGKKYPAPDWKLLEGE